jgi:hypothetical protein
MPNVQTIPRSFRPWWEAGFTDVIPVIPPGAPLSPSTRIKPEARGKAPGFKGRFGWRSFDWLSRQTTEADIADWSRDGANVGLRATRFPGLDIDVTDPDIADMLADLADRHLGHAPARTGRAPKRLLLYRLADGQAPMTRRRLWFKGPDDTKHLIEFLGHGQQFVVDGRHPATGRPYAWDRHPTETGPEALAPVTGEQVDAFFYEAAELLAMLYGCEEISPEGTGAEARDRASIDQDGLRAPSLDRVRLALDLAPNPAETTRTDYLAMGYAVRAALPDDPEGAYALFEDWALKWPGDDTPETIRADWERMKPPYEVGWNYLRDAALPHGYPAAEEDFEDEGLEGDAELAALEEASARRAEERREAEDAKRDRIVIQDFAGIVAATDHRTFVEDLFVHGSMAVIYGESNVGKTFLATDIGMHVAWGRDWMGRDVEQGAVVYCALEGAHGIRNRVAAFKRKHGLEGADIPFGVITVPLNILDPNADTAPLIEQARAWAARKGVPLRLVVLDTLARAMAGGNENASEDMGALVGNVDTIRSALDAAVLIVHHSGKDRAQGARGHSSLRAATDTEIEVFREEGAAASVAVVKKQRDLEGGRKIPFTLEVVEIGETPKGKVVTSCVVAEASEADAGPEKASGQRFTGAQRVALQALDDLLEAEGAPAPEGSHVPEGALCVPLRTWKGAVLDAGVTTSEDAATKRRVFNRIKADLIEVGAIGACPNSLTVWRQGGGTSGTSGTSGTKRDMSQNVPPPAEDDFECLDTVEKRDTEALSRFVPLVPPHSQGTAGGRDRRGETPVGGPPVSHPAALDAERLSEGLSRFVPPPVGDLPKERDR